MAFSLCNLRSFMFRNLVAGLGSENHRRGERSSGKGRYSWNASEFPHVSLGVAGRTVAVLHMVAYERSAINQVNASRR